MMYAVETTVRLTYLALLDADSPDQAKAKFKQLAKDHDLKPDSVESNCEAFAVDGVPPKKPAGRLIAPSWERSAI